MDLQAEKDRALVFLKNLEKPNVKELDGLLANGVEFEMMGRLPGVAPIKGKDALLKGLPVTLTQMFPNGLNLKIHTVIAEGNQVAIQAESDTTAANGKKYANRYHFYFRFDGDRIVQIREYNDTNHVREVFMS